MARRATKPKTAPRPTDAELAERLNGTRGLCLARQGSLWRDIVTGAVGTREELETAWLSERAR